MLGFDAVVGRLRAAGCVFAEDEAELILGAARSSGDVDGMVARRVSGEPLEQVVGWAELCGLKIFVEPGVFVPRRRSEFLVRQAVEGASGAVSVVVDVCCGAGALGAAVASGLTGSRTSAESVELYAADIDPVAVRCARRNVAAFDGRVYEGDLYGALPAEVRGRVDVLIANAPYVPTEEIPFLPAEAREHEPRVALDGGADGVDVQRRVAAGAAEWLAPGGRLLIETSERQAPETAAAMARGGLVPRVVGCEELGATVVIGELVVGT
ncbi:putative protein N(5)-glutamine methyltransferase [Streptomyces sp. NPDC002851]